MTIKMTEKTHDFRLDDLRLTNEFYYCRFTIFNKQIIGNQKSFNSI
jgi:hypothetical protein